MFKAFAEVIKVGRITWSLLRFCTLTEFAFLGRFAVRLEK